MAIVTGSLDSDRIKQQALALGFHKVGIARVEEWEVGFEVSIQPNGIGDWGVGGQKSAKLSSRPFSAQTFESDSAQPTDRHPPPAKHSPHPLPPTPARLPPDSPLSTWLAQGYHADMAWMANPKRQDIRSLLPSVRSVICVALNYYTPHDRPVDPESGSASQTAQPHYAKISRYGWGRDYHRILHKRLKALATWLQAQGEGIEARYYADTGPIPDKVWAERAGIGWIAKNSNVITREYGSWVFLGEVLTNLDLRPDRPHTQHCGTCTRCLDACPTQAITQPFVVDANRCIAYHTIENRAETLPTAIASRMQGWIAGCDICQDVCPWNQRFAQTTDIAEFQPYPWNIGPTLLEIAHLSDAEWEQRFPASALRRIKPSMLRRNARANLTGPSNRDDKSR